MMEDIFQRFQSAAPVDVSGLAKAIGINVWESDSLPGDVSGQIIRDPLNGGAEGYSILVRSSDSYVRRRFTVAHELAHFILHRGSIGSFFSDDSMYRSGLPNQQEIEANRYAANLLMPIPLLRRHVALSGLDSAKLAAVFEVSEAAMKIRLDGVFLRPGSGKSDTLIKRLRESAAGVS
jgi:IrrE N-terminal-like domain